MTRFHRAALAWGLTTLTCVATGCESKSDASKDEASGDSTAAASGETKAASAKKTDGGLHAKGNDPKVVELAEAVLEKCEYNPKRGVFTDCQEPMKPFSDFGLYKSPAAHATLVAMLEDDQAKVRALATRTADRPQAGFRKDADMAKRVLDAAEKESDPALVDKLARVAGRIDGNATGLMDRMKKLAVEHKDPSFRSSFLSSAFNANRKDLFDLVKARGTEEKDEGARRSIVQALDKAAKDQFAEVCSYWLKRVEEDDDVQLAASSANWMGMRMAEPDCSDQFAALLTAIETHAKAGTADHPMFGQALHVVWKHKNVNPADKSKSVQVAKVLVENPDNDSSTRATALTFVSKQSGADVDFAKKFLEDGDPAVKNAAERALK